MTDTFKGIITADGKKRQLPYNAVFGTPVSDPTLSLEGAFADSKAVGDKFKEVKTKTDSLKEDLYERFDEDGTGENKCNPKTLEDGKINVSNGIVDKTDAYCRTTAFIKIPSNVTKVVVSDAATIGISYQRVAFYKVDRSFISCTYSGKVAVDIPSAAFYVRVSNVKENDMFVAFNNDGIYNGFSKFVIGKLHNDRLPDEVVTNEYLNSILHERFDDIFPIRPDKTTFFSIKKSTNLFDGDFNSFEIGRLKNGEIDKSQATFVTSPIIDIGDNSGKYIVTKTSAGQKGTNASAFYDVNGKYISGLNYSNNIGVLLIPEKARYYRFSASTSQANYFVGINSENSADIPYEPYYNYTFIKKEYINKNELEDSWYKGKKAAALGDSITANGSTYYTDDGRSGSAWREFVAEELGLADIIYNCGIGGTKVSGDDANAMWQDSRIEAIPKDIAFLFFNGGMNDWRGNAQLGDENSIDTNTFYGALNIISKKITQKFPTIPIFFMTTTYGYRGDGQDDKNSIGLTLYDYGRAIKKVAEKHGFPCIDLHALYGWNQYNISQFVNYESSTEFAGFIHPNRNGGRKMATAICSVVKQYQPCEIK